MSTESTIKRYKTFDPDLLHDPEAMAAAAEDPLAGRGPADRAVRYLTWGILSVCLALWAVIGFIFWVPLLLRSMIHFSLALSQSMLQGSRPDEAGRILRETVGFYRRGFTVAIAAVFGRAPVQKVQKGRSPGLSAKRLVFEVLWAALFWYAALYLMGFIATSPADAWNALIGLPCAEWWQSTMAWVSDLFGGGGSETLTDPALESAHATDAASGGI